MNKYIKTDLQDSIKLMRIAIMNALNDIETGEEIRINLGPYISQPLLSECLQEAKWDIIDIEDPDEEIHYITKTPSGKEVAIDLEDGDYILFSMIYKQVSVSMCLSSIQEVQVPIGFNENDLIKAVKEQIFLPTNALEQTGCDKEWTVDDFVVV